MKGLRVTTAIFSVALTNEGRGVGAGVRAMKGLRVTTAIFSVALTNKGGGVGAGVGHAIKGLRVKTLGWFEPPNVCRRLRSGLFSVRDDPGFPLRPKNAFILYGGCRCTLPHVPMPSNVRSVFLYTVSDPQFGRLVFVSQDPSPRHNDP